MRVKDGWEGKWMGVENGWGVENAWEWRMDGSGEWMGVENGFPSLERRGGCAINRIDPFL